MKHSLISLFIIPTIGISSLMAAGPRKPVHVLSTKRYLFHFRIDKALVGAKVEILDECNVPVCFETASNTKNILDFFELPPGNYTIRITKAQQEFVFPYVNRE